jgi:hypothetical protein
MKGRPPPPPYSSSSDSSESEWDGSTSSNARGRRPSWLGSAASAASSGGSSVVGAGGGRDRGSKSLRVRSRSSTSGLRKSRRHRGDMPTSAHATSWRGGTATAGSGGGTVEGRLLEVAAAAAARNGFTPLMRAAAAGDHVLVREWLRVHWRRLPALPRACAPATDAMWRGSPLARD